MASIDRDAPVRFLRTAFTADDSVGVLLKIYRTGQVVQRIVPVTTAASDRFQAWLRDMNARGWNVYVSVNAYRPVDHARAMPSRPSGTCFSRKIVTVPACLRRSPRDRTCRRPPTCCTRRLVECMSLWRVRDVGAREDRTPPEAARATTLDRSRRHVVRPDDAMARLRQSQAAAVRSRRG